MKRTASHIGIAGPWRYLTRYLGCGVRPERRSVERLLSALLLPMAVAAGSVAGADDASLGIASAPLVVTIPMQPHAPPGDVLVADVFTPPGAPVTLVGVFEQFYLVSESRGEGYVDVVERNLPVVSGGAWARYPPRLEGTEATLCVRSADLRLRETDRTSDVPTHVLEYAPAQETRVFPLPGRLRSGDVFLSFLIAFERLEALPERLELSGVLMLGRDAACDVDRAL